MKSDNSTSTANASTGENGTKKVGVYDRPESTGPAKSQIIIGLVVAAAVIILLVKYVF